MDSTAPEPKVIVPYRWSRLVSENAYPYPALSSSLQHGQDQQVNRKPDAVYYTSPSGRVLLSRKDVRRYLREVHSCKCYIDSNVLEDQNGVATFVKSFNFDPTLGCYLMPPPSVIGGGPSPSSPCLSWASQFPANVITRELESLVRMLRRQLVHKPDEVHRTLCDNDKENNNNSDEVNRDWMFKKWLARINWDEVVISNSGRIYLTNLSSTQLKHLLYECVRGGVVEPPMGVGLKSPPQVESKTVAAKVDKVKDQGIDKVKSQGFNNKVRVPEQPRAPTPPIEPSSTQKMVSPSPPASPPLPASVKGRGRTKDSGAGKSSHRRRRKSLDYQSQLSRDRVARARRQANETPEQTKKRLATQREREARQLEEKRQKALERTATVVYRHEPKMDSVIVSPPEIDDHHHHHHHQQEVVNYASSVVSSSAATELTENGGHKVYYEIQPVVSNQGLLKSIIRKETRSIYPVVRTLAPRPQPSTQVRPVPLESQALQDFRQAMDRLVRSKSKNPVSMVPLDLSTKVEPESKVPKSKVRESKASKSKASEYKVREPKASNSKVRESKASKSKVREPKAPKSKAPKSKTSKPKVQEPKVPVRRASLSKIVEAPRTLKTSAEPEVEVKKAARRERRNSQSRIKRASETPEQREVRLEKKREYNKRYRIKRRLSQMQEEDDKLAKMNQNPKVGRGAPDNEDDNHKVAKPKKLKESFADEVVGAADHQQYDPFDFENPYSSHYN